MLCSCGRDHISQDREKRLRPVTAYMDTFIRVHHQLPTQNEFQADTATLNPMLVLRDHTDAYAARQGCKADTDYMVGIWRADWYHYYKSWDHSFLKGSDEPL